jgi:hypothetical protein
LGFVDLAGEFGLEAVEFFAIVLFFVVVVLAWILHEGWFAWFGVRGEYLRTGGHLTIEIKLLTIIIEVYT